MTKEIIIVSFFTLLSSCSNRVKKERVNSEANEIKTEVNQENLGRLNLKNKGNSNSYSYYDTIISGNVKFQKNFEIWIQGEKDFNFYKNIERIANYGAPTYSFVELNDKANVAVVQVEAYEYSYHVLVDMNTGDTISLYGKPIFRKDNSIIFASNVDLESGYTENGFQVVVKNSKGFTLVNTTLLEYWGIAKASWLQKNKLLISKVTLDEKFNKHFRTGILNINLKECK